jgi:hypothetical protein
MSKATGAKGLQVYAGRPNLATKRKIFEIIDTETLQDSTNRVFHRDEGDRCFHRFL